jgi:hypothetical protein
MLNPINGRVVVDLSASNGGVVECGGSVFFDQNNQPVELDLRLASFSDDVRTQALCGRVDECLGGAPVRIRLSDGREMSATLEIVSNISFNSAGEAVARCLIGEAHSGKQDQDLEGSWRFDLTNVKLRICDIKSETPAPAGVPAHLRGWRLDKIAFTVAGREWLLKDEMFGEWKKQRDRNIHVPIVSATLTTPFQANDTAEGVCEIADVIAALLTLALGRSVRAAKVEHLDKNQNSIWWSVRNLLAFPFSRSGFPPIDNWQFGTVKTFIEGAYPIVVADRKWWLATLGMYMQVHVNPYIETKSMILNVLADRIGAKLGVEHQDAEIDAQLNAKLKTKDFRSSLHALLTGLSGEWTENRTNNLISTIKMWNVKPSFPEAIRRACQAVRLKPPPTKLLGTRHRLMHVGELHPSDMTLVEYLKDLESLVLLLIVRMLNYEGFIYLAKFGDREILLKDYLE